MEETGKCSTFYSLAHPNSLICARLFLLKGFSVPFVKVFSLSYVFLHVFVSEVLTSQSYGSGLVVCGIILLLF